MNKRKCVMDLLWKMSLTFCFLFSLIFFIGPRVHAETDNSDTSNRQETTGSINQIEQKDKVDEEKKEEVVKTETTVSETNSVAQPASGESTKSKEVEQKVKVDIPASVTGKKEQGAGTVIDFTTTGSKAFYTIQDKNQQTYYLIIDLEKTENNVYFLSDVNKEGIEGNNTESKGTTPTLNELNTQQQETESSLKNEKESSEKSKNNNWMYIAVFVVMAGVIYYVKVVKKKKKGDSKDSSEDDMDESYDDDFLVGDEDSEDEQDDEE